LSRDGAPSSDEAFHLQRLWTEHRRTPFPAADSARTPELQEIALYESWLGSIVEAALRRGGHLTEAHASMLEARRGEGNQALWAAAAGQPEHVRSYVARLLALEDALVSLPIGG